MNEPHSANPDAIQATVSTDAEAPSPKAADDAPAARGERYWFEGEFLTVRQVRERVPVLSSQTVRARLREGLDTRMAMLSVDPDVVRRKNGKRAAQRYRQWKG